MATPVNKQFRRQVRSFVFIWSGITLAVALATFIAIYMAYGTLTDPNQVNLRNVVIPPATTPAPVVGTETPRPTLVPSPTVVTTAEVAASASADALAAGEAAAGNAASGAAGSTAVAQLDTPVPTLAPTLTAIDDRRFHLGVQVQVSYDNMDQWLNVAKEQLSVNWVKQQVRWEDLEPERDNYDWFYTDAYIPAAHQRGLRVLVSVVTAPVWSREQGVDVAQHGPPANPQDYADFVLALLDRYPDMIHAVEVWNEQNLDREWTAIDGLVAADYVELLRVTYEAIKAEHPDVIVVSGALAPTGLSDGVRAWDDFVYLDQMIEAGLLDYADCIGAHHNGINVSPNFTWDAVPDDPAASFRGPFENPHHSWSFRSTLQTYANKIVLAGGTQKLCVTEFGWPSAEGLDGIPEGFGFALDNSLEEQRDYTIDALDNMLQWDIVWLAFLWNLNYGPQAGWAADNDNVPYSIIGPNFVFRPVFDAVRDWNRAYEARLAAAGG